jgi:hypothetical protein
MEGEAETLNTWVKVEDPKVDRIAVMEARLAWVKASLKQLNKERQV